MHEDNVHRETAEPAKVSANMQTQNNQHYSVNEIDVPQANATLWQKWLFGIGLIASLALFSSFILITVQQNKILQESIDKAPYLEDSLIFKTITDPKIVVGIGEGERDHIRLLLLENEIIKKKYHGASTLMRTQIFIKYLGFLTGMILSILGALFILGKFREYPTQISVKGEKIPDASLVSTSPGLILSAIGAAIMIITIVDKKPINVRDGAVYLFEDQSKVDTSDRTHQQSGYHLPTIPKQHP